MWVPRRPGRGTWAGAQSPRPPHLHRALPGGGRRGRGPRRARRGTVTVPGTRGPGAGPGRAGCGRWVCSLQTAPRLHILPNLPRLTPPRLPLFSLPPVRPPAPPPRLPAPASALPPPPPPFPPSAAAGAELLSALCRRTASRPVSCRRGRGSRAAVQVQCPSSSLGTWAERPDSKCDGNMLGGRLFSPLQAPLLPQGKLSKKKGKAENYCHLTFCSSYKSVC